MKHAKKLTEFSRKKKACPLIGNLIGADLPERDRLFREKFEIFEQHLTAAISKAKEQNSDVELDMSGISMTGEGDICIVKSDGTLDRKLRSFPDFDHFLKQSLDIPYVKDENPDRELSFTAAFNALWSPNATNWQPIRIVETESRILSGLSGIKESFLTDNGWCILFLRRVHYESLLGDVLEPFGFHVTAKEEYIDCGIYKETYKLTLASRGRGYVSFEINENNAPALSKRLLDDMEKRSEHYIEILKDSNIDEETRKIASVEIEKFKEISSGLNAGWLIPDEVLFIGAVASDAKAHFPDFDKLIITRRSERVASPNKTIPNDEIEKLISISMDMLSDEEKGLIQLISFDKNKDIPIKIGQEMFYALYGEGADKDTKKGGIGGFVPGMTIRNFLKVLLERFPGDLGDVSLDNIEALDDKELNKIAKTLPVKEKYLGNDIKARILRDGKYLVQGEIIINEKGDNLPILLLIRVMSTLAFTFGNFFLKFQNTHPYTMFILAKEGKTIDEEKKIFETVGKISIILALYARAMGYSGILKTGPIDLARNRITNVLVECLSKDGEYTGTAEKLSAGDMTPALIYQVGYALAGSDVLETDEQGEQNGISERKKDKRPPRKDSAEHYITLS